MRSGAGTIAYGEQSAARPARGYPAFAWSVLIYNLAVILWGALVRATGSGAGCGGHWPLCNGEVLPASPPIATVIELTHRAMSGVALVAAAALAAWGWKAFPAKHPVRRWALWSLVFLLTEALIGALLVLLGHVASNESVGRVFSLSTHLVNTFLLLASLALTAWWSTKPAGERLAGRASTARGRLAIGMTTLVLVAMAGVITALGDTLFPAHSLAQGIADDFASTASFLIRLRVIHPVLGIAAAVFLAFLAAPQVRASRSDSPRRSPLRTLSALLLVLLGAQIVVGSLTILLKAPLVLQLAHLLVADALWITLVLFASERLRDTGREWVGPLPGG
ncbi:MAG TPA: COX15/CtaA family protein [Bryobacteraceae bacterium]|nr:COX15/CtaA family protein [Bryobacteraceae bacterium]